MKKLGFMTAKQAAQETAKEYALKEVESAAYAPTKKKGFEFHFNPNMLAGFTAGTNPEFLSETIGFNTNSKQKKRGR